MSSTGGEGRNQRKMRQNFSPEVHLLLETQAPVLHHRSPHPVYHCILPRHLRLPSSFGFNRKNLPQHHHFVDFLRFSAQCFQQHSKDFSIHSSDGLVVLKIAAGEVVAILFNKCLTLRNDLDNCVLTIIELKAIHAVHCERN